jgi:hypothetical protein
VKNRVIQITLSIALIYGHDWQYNSLHPLSPRWTRRRFEQLGQKYIGQKKKHLKTNKKNEITGTGGGLTKPVHGAYEQDDQPFTTSYTASFSKGEN